MAHPGFQARAEGGSWLCRLIVLHDGWCAALEQAPAIQGLASEAVVTPGAWTTPPGGANRSAFLGHVLPLLLHPCCM